MPAYLKFVVSILVAFVAATAMFFEVKGGFIIPLLGAMMIGAVWLFPETRRPTKENKKV